MKNMFDKNEIVQAEPPAVVIGLGVTGLACVRLLAKGGITVYGVSLFKNDVGRASLKCRHVNLWNLNGDCDKIGTWLEEYVDGLPGRPVVFPTSDKLALMLALRYNRLKKVCRIWTNSFDNLNTIISKNRLYVCAEKAGVPIPPTLVSPQRDSVEAWVKENSGPYLIKPYYVGANDFDSKNRTFEGPKQLMAFVENRPTGAEGLIIQRILNGGDGWIYDCYGLCDKNGRVRMMATHRRIRQHKPNFGSTCYGEIPADPPGAGRQKLFDLSRKLLADVRYHGIFGIEWLCERGTGRLFLLDFNARPFLTIGHLGDCGLNLPLAAYREMCGHNLDGVPLFPKLQRILWIASWHHFLGFFRRQGDDGRNWKGYFGELLRSRSFAVWDLSDPVPGCLTSFDTASRVCKNIFSRN